MSLASSGKASVLPNKKICCFFQIKATDCLLGRIINQKTCKLVPWGVIRYCNLIDNQRKGNWLKNAPRYTRSRLSLMVSHNSRSILNLRSTDSRCIN